jgi:acetyltransferase-like isoleucine patch superfamily enzyme
MTDSKTVSNSTSKSSSTSTPGTNTPRRTYAVVGDPTQDGGVFVHPMGLCESTEVGARTRIWAFAHVLAGAKIGSDCNICDHAYVESGAVVGDRVTVKNATLLWDQVTVADDVFLGPGVVFTNDLNPRARNKKPPSEFVPTFVGPGATIGANATIVCGVKIGAEAFVAAGSVVTADVKPNALVRGNPARQAGWVCECGLVLGESLRCTCGRLFELLDGALVSRLRGQ